MPVLRRGRRHGAELERIEWCCLPSPSFKSNFKKWLVAGAGGYVGEAEHFPAFSMEAGEAQAFGQSPIVHISTGTSSRPLCGMTVFALLRQAGRWCSRDGFIHRAQTLKRVNIFYL